MFKAISNLLKKIFHKKIKNENMGIPIFKPTINSLNHNSVKQDEQSTTPTLSYINWDLIKQLEKYDIVYVEMSSQCIASSKNAIPNGHQTRPFVIENVFNENNTIDGYYTTSNPNCCRFLAPSKKRYKMFISAELNNPDKKSLVLIDKKASIPYQNIKYKMKSMNNEEINSFKKKLFTYNKRDIISNKDNKIIDVGDIVCRDYKNYYIYQKDNSYSYGYNITYVEKYHDSNLDRTLLENPSYILIHPNIYKIDYMQRKQFSNDDSITINDISNIEMVYEVEAKKKLYKRQSKMRH